MSVDPLPLFVLWEGFLDDLLSRTKEFPRRIRWTLTNRIENLALDIYEDLVEARFNRKRQETLRGINRKLERLRILLRLCHGRAYLSHKGFERMMEELAEAGQMLGGWLRWENKK